MHKTAINDQTNTKQIIASNEQQTNNNKRKDTVCRESNVTERKGCVMRSTKSNGSAEIDELEENIAGNIRTLTRTSGTFPRPENGDGETSGDDLSKLLRRVSEASTREIESLIDELHGLRKKLESHGEHIQTDIAKYTELAQGVMQLTAIISDNVKKLPPGAMAVSR